MKILTNVCVAVVSGLLFIQPAAAQTGPTYWQVTGVADDDTLNVRAGPSSDSADIGDLPPDARGIEVGRLDESGDWGRIVYEDIDGWVAMRFMAEDPQPLIPETALPQGLLCAGTEPFWSVRFSGGSAVYSDIDDVTTAVQMTGAVSPAARGPFPVIVSHGSPTAAAMSVIEPQDCSDGMSDRTYPWRILFLLRTAEAQTFVEGCCNLPLEAGLH